MKIKDIVILSILSTILFVSEQILTFIPNVQITFLLIIVYSKTLKLHHSLIIIFIHCLLDNLFMGSFNIIYFPCMLVGYSIIPITIKCIKIENEIILAILSIFFSFIYCLLYAIPSTILTGVNFIDYIIVDIPFAIVLSISSFVSILWLYKPLKNRLENLINEKSNEN